MMNLTRPIGYAVLAILMVAAYIWSNTEPEKHPGLGKKSATAKKGEQAWDFPASLTSTKFDKPGGSIRNIFKPLLYVDKTAALVEAETLMKVPANLAQGEANWAYTGMVEIDGVKLALLENSATHQGGYVKEGETWKKSRIVHITSASIVVSGPDGSEQTVFRYNANQIPKPKPAPDAGFRPIDLGQALRGPIGPEIEINRVKSASKQGAPTMAVPDN